jgi:parallel beta-helix repeat protein
MKPQKQVGKGFLLWMMVATGWLLMAFQPAFPVCVYAAGNTFYVATSGADSNNGSSTRPWRTLQHAVESIVPGDTILVRSGTYKGCRIESSGTSKGWKTLKAASGAKVLINAPGPKNSHKSNIEIETWEGNGTVAYWVIQDLEVANAPSWGIDTRGNETHHSRHITINHNNVHDNGLQSGRTGIFFAFVDYALVIYNESYHNGEHGIYMSNSGDYPIVRGNRIHHNMDCGLHMNGDKNMGGDGIISGGLIEDNVIYGNGTGGGSAINMDGVTDSLVRNNLLYGNLAGGIALFKGNGAVGSHNNKIYNNTIVMPAHGRWAVRISDVSCINNQLLNNIIVTSNSFRGSIVIPVAALPGFISDYNVVVDRLSVDGDTSIITLSQWRRHGYGTHSLIASPAALFVNFSENDFRLRTGSPAIDAGTTLADVNDDLEGKSRPQGNGFDIGAYEYGKSIAYASVTALWPVYNAHCGSTSTLWAQVKNTGGNVLPGTAKAWYWVGGPSWSGTHWVGSASVEGLGVNATKWVSYSWVIPSGKGSGNYTYWTRVYMGHSAISAWKGPQAFMVSCGFSTSARIFSLWPITGAHCGHTFTLWAQVKNTGSSTLPNNARAWFWVTGPSWSGSHWLGSASVSGLAANVRKWVFYSWAIPSGKSPGGYTYWAQVWIPGKAISPWKGPQWFSVSCP